MSDSDAVRPGRRLFLKLGLAALVGWTTFTATRWAMDTPDPRRPISIQEALSHPPAGMEASAWRGILAMHAMMGAHTIRGESLADENGRPTRAEYDMEGGRLIVIGDVPAGSELVVKNGALIVTGWVGRDAQISVETPTSYHRDLPSIRVHGGVQRDAELNGNGDIVVSGPCATSATLDSSHGKVKHSGPKPTPRAPTPRLG